MRVGGGKTIGCARAGTRQGGDEALPVQTFGATYRARLAVGDLDGFFAFFWRAKLGDDRSTQPQQACFVDMVNIYAKVS